MLRKIIIASALIVSTSAMAQDWNGTLDFPPAGTAFTSLFEGKAMRTKDGPEDFSVTFSLQLNGILCGPAKIETGQGLVVFDIPDGKCMGGDRYHYVQFDRSELDNYK
jgi:hypothetical protein